MVSTAVFHRELVRAARKGHPMAFRVLIPAILLLGFGFLLVLGPQSEGGVALSERILDPTAIGRVAVWTFLIGLFVQFLIVLGLTPDVVAGALIEERNRRTLPDLLASDLNAGEIILGKLAARLCRVASVLAGGLPVIALLSVFGNIAPSFIALSYLGLLTTAVVSGSLSMLGSLYLVRIRGVIHAVMLIQFLWVLGPIAAPIFLPEHMLGESAFEALVIGMDGLAQSSPLAFAQRVQHSHLRLDAVQLSETLTRMILIQSSAAMVLVAWTVIQLRDVSRGREGGSHGRYRLWDHMVAWRWRIVPKRRCENDPMLWKEWDCHDINGIGKLFVTAIAAVSLFFLINHMVALGRSAWFEISEWGWWSIGAEQTYHRGQLNGFIRVVTALGMMMVLLSVVAGSACGITSERERDCWISLITTTLRPWEILRAKMVKSARLGLALIPIWLVGIVLGAIHPIALPLAFIGLAVPIWFVSSIGITMSMRCATSTDAQSSTAFLLMMVNFLPLISGVILQSMNIFMFATCMPALETSILLTYPEFERLFAPSTTWQTAISSGDPSPKAVVLLFLASQSVLAIVSLWLTRRAIRQFDVIAERPDRSRQPTFASTESVAPNSC